MLREAATPAAIPAVHGDHRFILKNFVMFMIFPYFLYIAVSKGA
jgi:hypothetical protein